MSDQHYRIKNIYNNSIYEIFYYHNHGLGTTVGIRISWKHGEWIISTKRNDLNTIFQNKRVINLKEEFSEVYQDYLFETDRPDFFIVKSDLYDDEIDSVLNHIESGWWNNGFEFFDKHGWEQIDNKIFIENGLMIQEMTEQEISEFFQENLYI